MILDRPISNGCEQPNHAFLNQLEESWHDDEPIPALLGLASPLGNGAQTPANPAEGPGLLRAGQKDPLLTSGEIR